MPARRIRYRMDNKSFGEMMMSDQTGDFAQKAARDIAAVASGDARLPKDPYVVDMAVPPVVLDGNPRVVAHVVGETQLHVVEEFGSGTTSEGKTAGQPRPQGGYSPARRTLAQAGDKVIPLGGRKPA